MIAKEQLQEKQYYYGQFNGNHQKTARWNGSKFILWAQVLGQHGKAIEVEYGEFEPLQEVTWGTNWIPMHSGVERIGG
jgi:hypothetical protein